MKNKFGEPTFSQKLRAAVSFVAAAGLYKFILTEYYLYLNPFLMVVAFLFGYYAFTIAKRTYCARKARAVDAETRRMNRDLRAQERRRA